MFHIIRNCMHLQLQILFSVLPYEQTPNSLYRYFYVRQKLGVSYWGADLKFT